MTVTRAAGQVQSRRTIKPIVLDAAAVEYAIRLIYQVCCFAGSFDLIEEFHDPALSAAVARHDTAALFDRLTYGFSFQGISDQIAANLYGSSWPSHLALSPEKSCRAPKLPQAPKPLGFS